MDSESGWVHLANALQALGVNFIMGGIGVDESLHTHPVRLISELACGSG